MGSVGIPQKVVDADLLKDAIEADIMRGESQVLRWASLRPWRKCLKRNLV